MRQELQEKLVAKYPDIFRDTDKPHTVSLMCFGISVGDGWYQLLDTMCEKLTAIQTKTGIVTKATQVKEKFGTLRFYYLRDQAKHTTFIANRRVWLNNLQLRWLQVMDRIDDLLGDHQPRWVHRFIYFFLHPNWLLFDVYYRYSLVHYKMNTKGIYKRFPMHKWSKRIRAIVDQAEVESGSVCETCGKPGRTDYSKAFIATACDECAAKRTTAQTTEEEST